MVEGSSEDEEEEVDHELVEKKVKWALLVTMPLGFPTAITRCSRGPGALPDAHRDLGHHWLLMGARAIAGCLQGPGALLDAHRGWGIARCLQGAGALLGA